jgi:hypothetical protein
MEAWPSGLWHCLGKAAVSKEAHEFESHRFRQLCGYSLGVKPLPSKQLSPVRFWLSAQFFGSLAQLVEYLSYTQNVVGSNPSGPTS